MKILPVRYSTYNRVVSNAKKDTTANPRNDNYRDIQALQNKAFINFGGYYGDPQPIKKLYWIVSGRNTPEHDFWAQDHFYYNGNKRWVNAAPNDLLKRTPREAINTIMTITNQNEIPSNIQSPNIKGDKWGRHANYIEINPRLVARLQDGTVSDGLFGVMKLMAAIPPSSNIAPNCLLLSQLYPSFYGDGTFSDGSLYLADLHRGISRNLTARGLDFKMGDDEQVRAFNDLAHLMGFKTGFRMPISSGQLRVKGEDFSWAKHEKAFIDACVWGIELGFDSIFFDSAKHIIDMDGYCGIGDVPNKNQMAYILYKIREQTGRPDLAFVGEKCTSNTEFGHIGLTAGTHWSNPSDFESVRWESEQQKYSREYSAGPEVSNDNDYGEQSFESRLKRIDSSMYGFKNPNDRLPSFMQINDIFPLSSYINTHQAMMNIVKTDGSNAWSECERHWDGVFRYDRDARNYTQSVYKIFSSAMYL